jgi:hypothetical protein
MQHAIESLLTIPAIHFRSQQPEQRAHPSRTALHQAQRDHLATVESHRVARLCRVLVIWLHFGVGSQGRQGDCQPAVWRRRRQGHGRRRGDGGPSDGKAKGHERCLLAPRAGERLAPPRPHNRADYPSPRASLPPRKTMNLPSSCCGTCATPERQNE